MKTVKVETLVAECDIYGLDAPKNCKFSMFKRDLWKAFEVIHNGMRRSSEWFCIFLLPDKILGQDITAINLILEWGYIMPLYYPWISVGEKNRLLIDIQYLSNAEKIFQKAKFGKLKFWIVKNFYFPLLRKFGSRAFWTGKITPRDWGSEKTPCSCMTIDIWKNSDSDNFILGDLDVYQEYRKVYTTIRNKMK